MLKFDLSALKKEISGAKTKDIRRWVLADLTITMVGMVGVSALYSHM